MKKSKINNSAKLKTLGHQLTTMTTGWGVREEEKESVRD